MISIRATSSEHHQTRVLQALRRIMRAIDLHSRRGLHQNGLTTPQLICLLTIAERQPVSPGTISRLAHLSPSTVVGIIDRLQARGLVVRSRDHRDRRLVQLTLTPKGAQVAKDAPSPLQDRLAHALDRLPPSEQADIVRALERVVELMEAQDLDAAPILETGSLTPEPGPAPPPRGT